MGNSHCNYIFTKYFEYVGLWIRWTLNDSSQRNSCSWLVLFTDTEGLLGWMSWKDHCVAEFCAESTCCPGQMAFSSSEPVFPAHFSFGSFPRPDAWLIPSLGTLAHSTNPASVKYRKCDSDWSSQFPLYSPCCHVVYFN